MSDNEHELEYIFHPRSIAVVGISAKSGTITNNFFMKAMVDFGYQGKVQPIHPSANEIMGLSAYPSIADVPGGSVQFFV